MGCGESKDVVHPKTQQNQSAPTRQAAAAHHQKHQVAKQSTQQSQKAETTAVRKPLLLVAHL